MPQTQGNNTFAGLQGHECISLTTYRKSGRSVSTPVAFAVESGKLYAGTRPNTGKFKRIRSNPKVQLAPCTMRGKVVGPTIKAVARILPSDEEALVEKTFESNLSLMMRIGRFISNLGGGHDERVYLEIVPVEEEK